MTKKRKTTAIISAVLIVSLTVFIFYNSLQNGEESGNQSDFIVDIVNRVLSFFGISADNYILGVIIRKTAHFAEYFLLGSTAMIFLSSFENKKLYPLSPTYCLIVAICDEFIMQMFTEGRAPQWTDVLIDFSGALTALCVVALGITIVKRKKG